ncbi:MAG: hypothetical protein R3Y28_05355 [Candidatus Gastranaerophilales bacterium]
MFKKLAYKLKLDRNAYSNNSSNATNPIDKTRTSNNNEFLNKLSLNTVNLFEKENDIEKFSKLVLDDFENFTPEITEINLKVNDIFDPFEEEKLLQLSENKRFLKDLGFEE